MYIYSGWATVCHSRFISGGLHEALSVCHCHWCSMDRTVAYMNI